MGLILPQVGIYLPFYDIFRNHLEEFTSQNAPDLTPYVPLVAGSLSRSLACTSCYPIELARTRMQVFSLLSSMFYICWGLLLFSLHFYFLVVSKGWGGNGGENVVVSISNTVPELLKKY